MTYDNTPIRMTESQNTENTKGYMEQQEFSFNAHGNIKSYSHFARQFANV